MTIAEALALAVDYHQRGDLGQAEHLYRQILDVDPRQVDALQLLGVLVAQRGRHDLASDFFSQALSLKPDFAEAYFNLGVARLEQGNLDGAVACFEQAIQHKPDYAEAHHSMGVVLRRQGKDETATASLQWAVRLRPDHAPAHHELGLALAALGRQDEALTHFQQTIRLAPGFAAAHNNLGVVLQQQGRLREAATCYQEAIRLDPRFADGHFNLANVLLKQGDPGSALACYEEALRLNPRLARAHNCRGTILLDRGEVTEALSCFEHALALEPEFAEAHLNRGSALLLLGRLTEGWPEYDWRRRCADYPGVPLALPHWEGSDLTGKTIVLTAEQGLGDTIQFIRYAPLVKQRGGTVVAACPPVLLPLLSGVSGVDRFVPKGPGAAGEGDVQALLMSLPGILGTTLDNVPATIPYLHAEPARLAVWRKQLADVSDFKIGIAWRGGPANPRDHLRSVPLTQFAPLARLTRVRLYNLQVGPGREELTAKRGLFSVTDLVDRFDPVPFLDLAAVVKCLDLVVTVDTSLAHLAGALGAPVWVALAFAPDWRWLLEREDSPWYPTMRLFRQPQAGNWEEVFQHIANELAAGTEGDGVGGGVPS